jgi:hypothetical protein
VRGDWEFKWWAVPTLRDGSRPPTPPPRPTWRTLQGRFANRPTAPSPGVVGIAPPWGLDIFSIQDKRVPIAVGIIIGVGVGIGIGIDPDPDSDPDTDGNQEQTDRQQPGGGHRPPTQSSKSSNPPKDIACAWRLGIQMVGGAHPTRRFATAHTAPKAHMAHVAGAVREPPLPPQGRGGGHCLPLGFGHFFNIGQTRPDRGRDHNRCRGRYRNRNRSRSRFRPRHRWEHTPSYPKSIAQHPICNRIPPGKPAPIDMPGDLRIFMKR